MRAPDDRHAHVDAAARPCPRSAGRAGGRRRRRSTRWASSSALLRGDALVGGALGVAERPAVAGEAVQAVVQALGDVEELRVARDRHPARVEAGAAHVADQRPQHLRHAAAVRGGVDVPEGPPFQQLAPARDRMLEIRQALGREDVAEALGVERRYRDVVQGHGASLLARRRRWRVDRSGRRRVAGDRHDPAGLLRATSPRSSALRRPTRTRSARQPGRDARRRPARRPRGARRAAAPRGEPSRRPPWPSRRGWSGAARSPRVCREQACSAGASHSRTNAPLRGSTTSRSQPTTAGAARRRPAPGRRGG